MTNKRRRPYVGPTFRDVLIFTFLLVDCCLSNIAQQGEFYNKEMTAVEMAVPIYFHSGTYHACAYFGQPPQRQNLILDTGSRFAAIACHPFKDCDQSRIRRRDKSKKENAKKNGRAFFYPGVSSTLQNITCDSCQWESSSFCARDGSNRCETGQRYTEGSSWKAHETNDIVTLGPVAVSTELNNHAVELERYMDLSVPFTFACQYCASGQFMNQHADGIMGLESTNHSIIHVMKKEGVIAHESFSLCLARDEGFLGLGGAIISRHKQVMRFTPILNEPDVAADTQNQDKEPAAKKKKGKKGLYAMRVVKMFLGDTCIACDAKPDSVSAFMDGKGTILDSGTTDTFLPAKIADDFNSQWRQITGSDLSQEKDDYSYEDFLDLPNMTFVFEGNATLIVPPAHYMEGSLDTEWEGTRELTNRVYLTEENGAVLGLNAMLNYDIQFDIENDRIGFARADCTSRKTIK